MRRCDFNPRTPVGCDRCLTAAYARATEFQSTHPSGVRPAGPRSGHSCRYFNPRTPVGCDQHPERIRLGVVDISIRAPQWGATSTVPSPMRRISYFNPRTPVGCDRSVWASFPSRTDFNPRTPVGCDKLVVGSSVEPTISIHAPQWGATAVRRRHQSRQFISIHAPQWGATRKRRRWTRRRKYFNPRTPVGCDGSRRNR